MEALLRQSRSMCPFMKKTSPSALRNLSTTVVRQSSPGGCSMSNLQSLTRRCPVMGKAMAVQSARNNLYTAIATTARAYHSTSKVNLHQSSRKEATVHRELPRQKNGESQLPQATAF